MLYALLIPLVLWAPFALSRLAFVLLAKRLPATIVEIAMCGEDGDVPAPVAEYRHPSGELRRVRPRIFSSGYSVLRIGEPMSVLVLGNRARIATFAELWVVQLILVGSALAITTTMALIVSR